MKIAALHIDGQYRQALVREDRLHPLPAGTDLFELLAAKPGEEEVLSRCAAPIALVGQHLLPPVRPASIRDFITFEQHVEGSFKGSREPAVVPEWYEIPTFYFTNPHALIGPRDDVPVPPGSAVFDFELEVAAVIGVDGHNLPVEEAEGHIAGYSIFNDWSARDLQMHEMRVGLGPAKGKDTASTLGPYLVTPDELEPYRQGDRFDLTMSVSVNGTLIGKDSLANSAWSFPEMIAYASRGTVVRAGDILGSGTCGSGCLVELWGRNGGERVPPPLAVGDTVTMHVDGLGTIENSVVAGQPVHPVPTARRNP
ncbi:MAG TPA: fumarylacetoacetate hydrolase family protein [Pseudonocardia sp.]|uniref:fumarylacetoacetate hydrolase family protein n=1 Tax=Pseudonocardia sp. TaxID=60912 RepID=UPI002C1CDC9B|nr:fumarylacetoacetate hydrolase family protein [Pseudonocardia sp.]HTF49796.1 fumarylacetoacetate hydrolase family protein [Pseudonocardia sp.]